MTEIDDETLRYDARDDWFGDGTAFNSQTDLAAALESMTDAPAVQAPVLEPVDAAHAHVTVPERSPDFEESAARALEGESESGDNGSAQEWDSSFEFVHAHTAESVPAPVKPQPPAANHAEPKVATWSVRVPGVQLLPQRQPGRTGWSMENSVRILRQADELVVRLREEAIVTAFSATARALRGGGGPEPE